MNKFSLLRANELLAMSLEESLEELIRKTQERPERKILRGEDGKQFICSKTLTDSPALASIAIADLAGASGNNQVVADMAESLEATIARVKSGNLEELEAMLVSQAFVLNNLFVQLASKGERSLSDPTVLKTLPHHPKTMLDIALKAQNQCRATVEAINNLKNPKKTTFIKNQLNNVKLELEERIEALEEVDRGSKALDGGTEAIAIPKDRGVETLGELDRSANPRGQSQK